MPSLDVLSGYYNRAGIGSKPHCEHLCSRLQRANSMAQSAWYCCWQHTSRSRVRAWNWGVPASGDVRLGAKVWLDQVLCKVVGNVEGALGVRILREGQALHEVLCPTPVIIIQTVSSAEQSIQVGVTTRLQSLVGCDVPTRLLRTDSLAKRESHL